MSEPIKFYRYEDFQTYDGPRLSEHEFSLIKETPCGWWIRPCFFHSYQEKPRWVSKTARKRFAYPTKEEALISFMARKQRQIIILEYKLEWAEQALGLAQVKAGVAPSRPKQRLFKRF